MTEHDNSPQVDPQDGFDLLEYPCRFQFKAMLRVAGLQEGTSAQAEITALVANVLPATEVLDTSSNLSRTGKFESVSLTVELQSREQLEAVYSALAADPNVVMTL